MREVLYCLWWRIWLCEPEERACLEADADSFAEFPPTSEELKKWRARSLRYNRVYFGVRYTGGAWGSKPKRRRRK